MVGLAVTPQGDLLDPVHQAFGALAMGGLYAALLVCWPLALRLVPASRIRVGCRVLLWVASGWGVLGFLVTQGFRFLAYGELGHVLKDRHESLWLRFSFWEWMLFACGSVGFAVWCLVLGESDEVGQD
jgi:hypothetical protein